MIKVTVGTNFQRQSVIVDENTTIRKVFEDSSTPYTVGQPRLNNKILTEDDFDKTFADFSVTETCLLLNTAKQDNA